jgi:hypothetical protein
MLGFVSFNSLFAARSPTKKASTWSVSPTINPKPRAARSLGWP